MGGRADARSAQHPGPARAARHGRPGHRRTRKGRCALVTVPQWEPGPGDDRPFYDMNAQTMPREKLHELRTARMRGAIERVFTEPVPFFQRTPKPAGTASPDDAKDRTDLSKIRVTVKQERRGSEAEHPPAGDYRGASI